MLRYNRPGIIVLILLVLLLIGASAVSGGKVTSSNSPWLEGLLGVGLLVLAATTWRSMQGFMQRAQPADGTVMEVKRRRRSQQNPTFISTVRYPTAAGEQVEFSASHRRKQSLLSVGDTVPVLYDPTQPKRAYVKSFSQLWLASLLLAIFGSVAIIVAIVTALVR